MQCESSAVEPDSARCSAIRGSTSFAGQIAAAPADRRDYDTRGGAVVRGAASSLWTVLGCDCTPGQIGDLRQPTLPPCLFMEPAFNRVGNRGASLPPSSSKGTGRRVFTARFCHPGARRTGPKSSSPHASLRAKIAIKVVD